MKTAVIAESLVLLWILINTSASSVQKSKKKPAKINVGAFRIKSNSDAFTYLSKFGYNKCDNQPESNKKKGHTVLCQSSVESMVKDFQTVYQLPVTGELDRKTLSLMNTPRCGMKDQSALARLTNLW